MTRGNCYPMKEASSNGTYKKYMSHGQSQSFMAATPLPRAMEYETASRWRNPCEEILNTKEASFMTFCLGICKHGKFAPYKAKEPNSPSVSDCVSIHIL